MVTYFSAYLHGFPLFVHITLAYTFIVFIVIWKRLLHHLPEIQISVIIQHPSSVSFFIFCFVNTYSSCHTSNQQTKEAIHEFPKWKLQHVSLMANFSVFAHTYQTLKMSLLPQTNIQNQTRSLHKTSNLVLLVTGATFHNNL